MNYYRQVMGLTNKADIDFHIADAEEQITSYALLYIQTPERDDWKNALTQWNKRLKTLKKMKANGL